VKLREPSASEARLDSFGTCETSARAAAEQSKLVASSPLGCMSWELFAREEQADIAEPPPHSFLEEKIWKSQDLQLLEEVSSPLVVVWLRLQSGR